MSRQTHKILTFWMALGFIGGGLTMKFLPIIFKNNYYIQKRSVVSFVIIFGTLTYHGFKVMNFEKRKAIRSLAKYP